MLRYFKNLGYALVGKCLCQQELEELRTSLNDAYEKLEMLEAMKKTVERISQNFTQMEASMERKLKDYQTLVENLRERIKDKDNLIKLYEQQ